jgi:heme-degrading monooxygenase HmoA
MRFWRGWTTREGAADFEQFVSEHTLRGIGERELDGYHGAYLLRRDAGDEVEFATILVFESLEAVRAFGGGGEDYESAYVPEGGRARLKRFDEKTVHYEVLESPQELA